MLLIRKLYTNPELIDPITFEEGFNLILGERNATSAKENSVGKSLSIEFLNFALLKSKAHSRVNRIPRDIFPVSTEICLDFELHGIPFTIKRSLKDAETPTIIENGQEQVFTKLEDATRFLGEKLFSDFYDYPSFRVMLGPLIRDEGSEFKSLIHCYDTSIKAPEDYTPHLYLLGIEIEIYESIKKLISDLEDITQDLSRIRDNVFLLRQKEIEDARADLNELDSEVAAIEESINKLENISGYEIVRDELILLEDNIDTLRRQKGIAKQKLEKLRIVREKVDITPTEISEFYDSLKSGLGTLIGKQLEEVMEFKSRIDAFQNKIISERKEVLLEEVSLLDKNLVSLDKRYSEILSILNQKGELKNLKQTYAAHREKSEQLSQLRSFVSHYEFLENEKQRVKSEKELSLVKLQNLIQEQKSVIDNFEKTILEMHEFIQGNRLASFQIKKTNKKQVIETNLRIDSDGGHSVDREKVFIYDTALLLNTHTQRKHPGFLIHDNIFDVDQDTLHKSLDYLLEKAAFNGTQYVLTLNSDKLDSEYLEKIEGFVRARFTKKKRFLKKEYQETKSG